MICPYCGNEMQRGEIFGDARGGMHFRQAGKKLGFFDMLAGVGRLTAARGWAQNVIPPISARIARR